MTLVQIFTVLANSKAFVKYVVCWNWLYPLSLHFGPTNSKAFVKYVVCWNCLYPLSLHFGPTNLQKATWPLFWE